MAKLQVEWTAHADFERMLAEVFQDDPIEGIKELVANGFDADATRFDLLYRPNSGLLVAKDNGNGMGEHELRSGFYRSGESLTRKAGRTKRGRNPMGSYGIGTIVMQYLARSYKLETWRDGKKLTIDEEFEEGKRPKKLVRAIPEACDPTLHGTTITINKIRFSPGDVTLEQLTRRLALGINVMTRLEEDDQFDVYVNNKKVQLNNPNPALVFSVNRHDNLVGQVHGKVYFYDRTPHYRGVIVRVNGRQVGSENYFRSLMTPFIQSRVYADIDVDMMASKISFSRARFQEDSPHFRKLAGILDETFRSLRGEIDGYMKDKVLAKGKTAVETAASGAVSKLHSVSIPAVPKLTVSNGVDASSRNEPDDVKVDEDTSLSTVLLSVDFKGKNKIVLVSEQQQTFGSIDHRTGALAVNVNHPYFTVPGLRAERHLQLRILYALSHILGQKAFESDSSLRNVKALHARDEAIWRIAQQVYSGQPRLLDALMDRRTGYSARRGVSPDRMYTTIELYQETPIDTMWLNRFLKTGILKPTVDTKDEERYYGANVILALERLKGGTPAFELVRQIVNERTDIKHRQQKDEMVHKVDNQIAGLKTELPYVFNISATHEPLYAVMPGYEQRFKEVYRLGHIRVGHVIPPEFLTIDEIVKPSYSKNPAVGMEGTESWNFMQFAANEKRLPHGLSVDNLERATMYNPVDRYHKGDIVLHRGFGYGIVVDVKDKTCFVEFKEGKLSVAHNR